MSQRKYNKEELEEAVKNSQHLLGVVEPTSVQGDGNSPVSASLVLMV